jgi:uncharacterized C2H2 Zn-finger protein
MAPNMHSENGEGTLYCPECGSAESGYFCRTCGALLQGEELVLCPRCHKVVPHGGFCNQCGQELGEIAPSLRQLEMAGETFWVTKVPPAPIADPEPGELLPDESVDLAAAVLPKWLQELSVESAAADMEARIYPSLQPIRDENARRQRRFLSVSIILLGIMLLGMMAMALLFLLSRGG